ncbi:hypothetical protein [Ekhidna sp.]|uniref:hypothetical protein n=1 Tax=Ekhidna sp. TaxID=2608089 RepID=UPI003514DACD
MEAFNDWLTDLSRISAIAGILYYLFTKLKVNQVASGLFLILFASFLADTLNYFFIRLVYPNSFIIGNCWLIINFFLVLWTFKKVINIPKTLLTGLVAGFVLGASISFIFFYSFTESNTFVFLWSNISFIILSLYLHFQLLKRPGEKLKYHPVFWIATSFFVYYSMLFLQNIFNNYLVFDLQISSEAYTIVWIINLIANVGKNFILFYALVLIDKGYPDTLKPAEAA